MTDRELLELAAKADGHSYPWKLPMVFGERDWNPLADDGDALRLAVRLCIQVGYSDFSGEGVALWDRGCKQVREYGPEDPNAATRRAVTRAAAEIGRQMA